MRSARVGPSNQLHNQCATGVGFLYTVDRSNVGVVQRRQYPRFTLKAGHAVGVVGKDLGEDFYRDITIETSIPGTVNLAHPARTNGGEDFIGP